VLFAAESMARFLPILLRMEDPMSNESSLTRREFTLEAALAILAGVSITISGCGSESSTPTSPSTSTSAAPPTDRSASTISANHGHTATILAAQFTAGNAISLDIRGQATHPHTVSISQAEMMQIAANQRVTKDSTTDNGHNHMVTFN
jgi:hypothetical protein